MKLASWLKWRQALRPRGRSPLMASISFFWYVLRRFNADHGLTVASALTYTSLLGLIPILAIFLAFLGAFPAFYEIRDQIKDFMLSPLLPEVSTAARDQINIFLSNTRELTAVGVLGLAITAFILLWTIESAFNTIWRVVEPRSWSTRILAFWAILTLSPILLGTSLSLSNWFDRLAGEGLFWDLPHLLDGIPVLIPVTMQFVAFSLLFWIIPHRRIRWRHSFAGGFVAAVLFEMLKYTFGLYLNQANTYTVIYGALATIPIFLLWLYLSWCVILFGAEVAAAIPDWWIDRDSRRRDPPTPGERLAMALAVLRTIWISRELPHREELEKQLPGGAEVFSRTLADLTAKGYVVVTEDERLAIACDLSDVTLYDLHADLGLDVGARIGSDFHDGGDRPDRAAEPWVARLGETLLAVDRAKRELMTRPLKSFITWGLDRNHGRAAAE